VLQGLYETNKFSTVRPFSKDTCALTWNDGLMSGDFVIYLL